MPTAFITGATGFIGRALCDKMIRSGWKVKAAFRIKNSIDDLPAGVEGVQMESIENYGNAYRDLEDVDVVIHLAGRAHIINDTAVERLDAFRRVNVVGSERLASAAAARGAKRFIFLSSVKVNGESSESPYTERDVPRPQDPYGVSKYEAEQALSRVSAKTGLKTVILRPPLVYGPGVKANFGNLIKMIASGMPLPLKNIHNRRSFIYLENLTDAIFTSIVHPEAAGETFLVSDCADVSTPDLVNMIACAMNKKAVLFSLNPGILRALCKIAGKTEDLEKLIGHLSVDSSKIRNLLGWNPPVTMEHGIKETVRSFRL